MKKIKYCSEEFFLEYKVNFEQYLSMYKEKDIDKIRDVFNEPNIIEGDIEFKYTPLVKGKDYFDPSVTFENIKILYNSLKHLTPTQASQEKLWIAMYNTYYIDNLIWFIEKSEHRKKNDEIIKSSIIFTSGKTRSLIVQKLSRLWWIGHFTYDKTRKDPYELTEFFTSRDPIGKSTSFFSSNFTKNQDLRLGIIEAIKEMIENKEIEYERNHFTYTNKNLNLIGGVSILDMMSREEVKNQTKKLLRERRS